MRLLEELDERQVRLGYVNCVVLTAGRQLDTRTALRRRFDGFVFRRVYEDAAEAAEFLAYIDDEGRQALSRQDHQRQRERGGSKNSRDPIAVLRPDQPRGGFRYVSHLWLLQRCMPSHLGPLAPDRSEVFLEHARHLGLLAETYALTETGYILKQLLLQHDPALLEGRASSNPLHVGRRLAVRALYMWALLENDAVTPFLLREFLSRRQNDPELLAAATKKLIDGFGRGARIDSALEMKALHAYHERVAKGASAAKTDQCPPSRSARRGLLAFIERGATAQPGFKIHRHHVRPRLEHYVDIGLLGRRRDARASETVYEPLPDTRRAVEVWAPLLEDPKTIRRFLDSRFFEAAARVFNVGQARPCTRWESLLYFARAFELVYREIGFTPGRTVAFTACLLALEEARLAEIDTMFEAVYAGAKTDLGGHLIFSGGSRFDREFLIRVKPEIVPALRARIARDAGTSSCGGQDDRVS
ncbi:MAG: hypothetical protein EYC70_13290 [Planctomycetota bacterium]|nr:MAG: hypothetical protein EYC70_13290 [Planctomycetota bacterium]